MLSCSPDQATFTNITAVQLAADNGATVVAEVDVWTAAPFTKALYDSCKARLGWSKRGEEGYRV